MNGTLYTPEVKEIFRSAGWPKGLIIDVIEYPTHLGFRFYRDNFITFSPADQRQIAAAVKEIMEHIRGLGIPCYMEKMESVSNAGSGVAT